MSLEEGIPNDIIKELNAKSEIIMNQSQSGKGGGGEDDADATPSVQPNRQDVVVLRNASEKQDVSKNMCFLENKYSRNLGENLG
jgi:hypothetical protein